MVEKKTTLKLEVVEFRFQPHYRYRQQYRRAHLYFIAETEEDHRKIWAEGRGHKHVNKSLFDAIKAYLRMHPDVKVNESTSQWSTGLVLQDKMYWDSDKFVFLKSKGFTLKLTVRVVD